MAPSRMASLMDFISGVPVSFLRIHQVRYPAKANPISPAIGIVRYRGSSNIENLF